MNTMKLNGTDLSISKLGLGIMRLPKLFQQEADDFLLDAIHSGINFFDSADIYGGGKSEEIFGNFLHNHPEVRKDIVIQSKASIVPGKAYDCSKEYIISAVKGILERLQAEYLDIFLLHRPDALMDYEEVAQAFDYLYESGLVKYFGVSNQTCGQMALLKKYCKQPIIINQLQLSIVHSNMIDRGIFQNMKADEAIDRDGDVLSYCMLNDILIQAWSPIQASWEDGTFINNPKYAKLNKVLEELSKKYNTNKSAIALAWILRHPAHIQPIIGTTSKQHLHESLEALQVQLTREEWYALYMSAGKMLP